MINLLKTENEQNENTTYNVYVLINVLFLMIQLHILSSIDPRADCLFDWM